MRHQMFKLSPTLIALVVSCVFSASLSAAVPKDIKFSKKGKTMFGGSYLIYSVRCSDGKVRKISSWDKRKKWCLGAKKSNCSNDQLQTAKKACK